MRLTHASLEVAMALLDGAGERQWGYDLARRAGVRSGVLYPILHRLLDEGWLSDGWEEGTETSGKRPPRRYYEVTDHGLQELGALVSRARQDARFTSLSPRWA